MTTDTPTISWSDLVAGSTAETEQKIWWNGLIFIALTAVVVGLFIMMNRQESKPSKVNRNPKQELIENIHDMPALIPDVPVAANDNHIKPKSAAVGKYWSSLETDTNDLPLQEDPESDFSYSKFQQALLSGADRQVSHEAPLRMHSQKDLEAWNEQLAPLRDMLTRSGKTLQQFMDEQEVALPEDVLEMWEAVQHMKAPTQNGPVYSLNSNVSAEEAASLVKDAIQSVPTTNVDFAAVVLREILHARTEAAALGIQIPALSPEQQRTIEFWRMSAQMPAADLANKLLSR